MSGETNPANGIDAPCIKCGWHTVDVDPTIQYRPAWACATEGSNSHPATEHLDIACGICGYKWAVPCADAEVSS